MLLRFEMSSFDGQKIRVTQLKTKIAVSRQYTVCIKTTTKNVTESGVSTEGLSCSKKRNEISWQHFDFSQAISHLVGYKTSDERTLFVD